MKVSMNGLRKSLCRDVHSLRDEIVGVLNDDHYEKDDLTDAMNSVICAVNTFNSVYSEDDEDFQELSNSFDVPLINHETDEIAE